MPWWLVFFLVEPILSQNITHQLAFSHSRPFSVSIPLIHSQSVSLTHPLSSSPSTFTSALSLARNHFPSHKLDHSFVVNSRTRPTCNVLPVRPGTYELAHVSSQINNSVLLVIWIFHWDSYRNQSDGSGGRTEAQCCKVRSICRWIALAIIQSSCDQRNIECVESIAPSTTQRLNKKLTGKWQNYPFLHAVLLIVWSISLNVLFSLNHEFQSVCYPKHLPQYWRPFMVIDPEETDTEILRNVSYCVYKIKRFQTAGNSSLRIIIWCIHICRTVPVVARTHIWKFGYFHEPNLKLSAWSVG